MAAIPDDCPVCREAFCNGAGAADGPLNHSGPEACSHWVCCHCIHKLTSIAMDEEATPTCPLCRADWSWCLYDVEYTADSDEDDNEADMAAPTADAPVSPKQE